ncbi:MAG: hypothetical protein VKK04_09815 [Synechococcales bacterium]|nr:hypothetical protein [Synechococcales bacterium]
MGRWATWAEAGAFAADSHPGVYAPGHQRCWIDRLPVVSQRAKGGDRFGESAPAGVDHKKRALEVAQITGSDYFQNIQSEVEAINLDEFWNKL